jgi:hypothetical protein
MIYTRQTLLSFVLGHMLVGTLMASSVVTENTNGEAGIEEKDITAEEKITSFFDISPMEEDEKRDLVRSIALLTDTDVDIDWVRLKENYQLSVSMDFPHTMDEKDEESFSTETDITSDRRKLGLLESIYEERDQPTMSLRPQGRSGHLMDNDEHEHDHDSESDSMHLRHRVRKSSKKKHHKAKTSKYAKHYKSKKKSYHYDDYYYYDDDQYFYYDDMYYDDYYYGDLDDYYTRHTHVHDHGGNSHSHSHAHVIDIDHHHSIEDESEAADGDDEIGESTVGGAVGGGYNFGRGNCPDAGSSGVPCAPDDLPGMCDKYGGSGSFRSCLDACVPSFCCIHDAFNNENAVPCPGDENCSQYSYCYIVWWKLHDTIGPATYLRLEQEDDFFDIDANEVGGDVGGTFFEELLLHHFDNIQGIIMEGTNNAGDFDANVIFNNPMYWQ